MVKVDKETCYLCITKIEVDSFGMSNVKDAIGLRRETSTNLKELVNEIDSTEYT